jgi:hypothetical protein
MSQLVKRDEMSKLEAVLIRGDLGSLSDGERVQYNHRVCESLGLNPLTRPLEYIKLNGRIVLYAKKDATDQLRKNQRVSLAVVSRETIADVFVVTARASTPEGRTDESVGAVSIAALKGEALANAMMKAETKAKRRVTLSICGLGMLDETEVETIPNREPVRETSRIAPREIHTQEAPQEEDPAPLVPEFSNADLMNCDCGNEMMVSKYNERELYCNPKSGGCGAKRPR